MTCFYMRLYSAIKGTKLYHLQESGQKWRKGSICRDEEEHGREKETREGVSGANMIKVRYMQIWNCNVPMKPIICTMDNSNFKKHTLKK